MGATNGQLEQGNIDLYNRPHVKNPDGSISTVRSVSFGIGGKEVLVPTVSDDGRIMSNDEALAAYKKTGKHLGVFDSPASANAYASQLHNDYAAGKYDKAPMSTPAVTPNQEFQYVKLPDGSYGKFRADASDDFIKSAITKDFPDAYKQTAPAAAPAERPGFLKRTAQSLGVPTSMNEVKGMSDQFNPIQHPSNLLSPAMPILRGYASNLGSRVKDMARESVDAGENIGKGQPVIPNLGKAGYSGMKAVNAAVPFIGENANNLGDDVAAKNWKGAAGDVVGTGLAVAGPEILGKGGKILKNQAYDTMNNVLGTYGRNEKFEINPGRGVVQEGIVAGSPKGLLRKINTASAPLEGQMQAVVSDPKYADTRIDFRNDVAEPFQEARKIGSEGVASNKYLNRLTQTQREYMMNRKFSTKAGQYVEGGPRNLTEMSPQDALAYKRSAGSRPNWSADATDESINPTLRQVSGRLSRTFETAIPESAPINERYSDVLTAKDVLGQQIGRRLAHPSAIGFRDVAPTILGTAAGGPIAGAATFAGNKAIGSTLFKTGAAQGLYRAGQAVGGGAPLARPILLRQLWDEEEEKRRLGGFPSGNQ